MIKSGRLILVVRGEITLAWLRTRVDRELGECLAEESAG